MRWRSRWAMSLGSRLYFSAMLSPAVVEAAMLGSRSWVV
jgi:hypothetical protein